MVRDRNKCVRDNTNPYFLGSQHGTSRGGARPPPPLLCARLARFLLDLLQ